MIRFSLRLTLRGGREAGMRLALTAAAVALGAGLLLSTLAGINAVNAQNARYAWLNTGVASSAPARPASTSASTSAPAPDPLWWLLRADYFGTQLIGRVDVAATGPSSPVLPGIPHLPGPGQYYASPALSQLLRSTPAAQLGDRFPGRQIGTIGALALPAPNSLLVIIGHTASQLSRVPGATQASSVQGSAPNACGGRTCLVRVGINANGIDLIFSVVALALLFPVLIFIAAATRLAAARREQRFAAMRLAGAAPRQVSVISAVESTAATITGVAAGFGLFFLFRPAVAAIPFTGTPFFPGDLSLSVPDILIVAVGVPAAAAVAARLALRRVHISPLGVSRRVTPAPPRAYRTIPLLAGIIELACFVAIGRPGGTSGQIAAYLPGFLLIMAGLIIAGPWLTMAGSRVMARRTSRPATLIAARRLSDSPRAGFRAISGLILALFITSVAVGVITTTDAHRGFSSGGPVASATLIDWFTDPGSAGRTATVPPVPAAVLAKWRSIPGVQGVLLTHTNPLGVTIPDAKAGLPSGWGPVPAGLVSCVQLSRTPTLGRCPAGAAAAVVPTQLPLAFISSQAATVWPAAAISAQRLQQLPVLSITVGTDGSASAIEGVRTALEAAYPGKNLPPTTIGEIRAGLNSTLAGEQQLANVVILTSLPIAGCTLAVSIVAGLSERKRPFSLLRLTGAPLGTLRRVVALESAVPLLIVAVVSIGAGFLAAQLFLTSQLHYSLRPPGTGYYLIVLAGLAASLGIVASTLPLLNRLTGPDTARNE
jgi:hypothetical protein